MRRSGKQDCGSDLSFLLQLTKEAKFLTFPVLIRIHMVSFVHHDQIPRFCLEHMLMTIMAIHLHR